VKKSLLISGFLFLVYLGLVSFPGGPDQYMVEFRTPGMPALEIKSANLLEEINQFQLQGISPDENVVAGLYEVALLGELRSYEANDEQFAILENALGIKIPRDPDTVISDGQKVVWTGDDLVLSNQDPLLRRYLQRHQATLDQVVIIANRERYANYYNSPDQTLVGALLPMVGSLRDYARTLKIRSRVALTEDRVADAIADTNAMYRLGHHLMSEGGTAVEVLVGKAVVDMSMTTWCEILSHPALTVDDLARISSLVESAPRISGVKALDLFERFVALDLAVKMERFGMFGFEKGIGMGNAPEPFLFDPVLAFVDWPEIYKRINQDVNDDLDVLLDPNQQQRRTRIRAMHNQQENGIELPGDFNVLDGPARATDYAWKMIHELFLDYTRYYLRVLEQARDQDEVLRVCIAVKQFHFQNQRYPASLEELKGTYLDQIPLDYGSGEAFRFIQFKAGALVYTVGQNETDDGGWGYGDLVDTFREFDDVTCLVGIDDRPAPDGYRTLSRIIPGRKFGDLNEREWDGKQLSLAGEVVSREEWDAVCRVASLKWLDLSAARLPDDWHQDLSGLENLRVLVLTGMEVTRETLEQVARLPALQKLVLNGTDVSGILQPIAGLTQLADLYLSRSSVTDDDLQVLAGLTNLQRLSLNETAITDGAAPVLGELTGLTRLHLSGTGMTDVGLESMAGMSELLELRVDFTSVTNAGVASLRTEKLQVLGLNGTAVDNGVVESLVGFQELREVYLYETAFTAEGQEQFLQVWEGRPIVLESVERPLLLEFTDTGPNASKPNFHQDQYPINSGPLYGPSEKYDQSETIEWGTLVGPTGAYEVLRDDTQLQVKLFIPGIDPGPQTRLDSISVMRPAAGDFDVRVKVIPDWQRHDQIMVDETYGSRGYSGGPYLAAGLLIQQSPGHYLRWCWNSIDSRRRQRYAMMTPEYLIYPKKIGGALQDFGSGLGATGFAETESMDVLEDPGGGRDRYDDDAGMLFPHPAIEGSAKYFDGEFFWLRLQRRGNTVTSLWSTDGESWTVTSEIRVRFGNEVQVGVWCGKLAMSDYLFTFEGFKLEP
jgi:hypothetical protein